LFDGRRQSLHAIHHVCLEVGWMSPSPSVVIVVALR
jgi:hypothetical protein